MVSFLLKVTLAIAAVAGILLSGLFDSKPPPPPPPPPSWREQVPPFDPSYERQDRRSEPQPQPTPQDTIPENSAEYYETLRRLARTRGNEMTTSFQLSREAYGRGDHRLAKELKDKGEKHKKQMEALDQRASDWIFKENNRRNEPGMIDLHGLFVKEAETRAETAIQQARQRGDAKLVFIVGKGGHSLDGKSKLKPAIEKLVKQHALSANYDLDNDGQLIVHMDRQRRS